MSHTYKDRRETRDYNKKMREERGKPKMATYDRNKMKANVHSKSV